MEKRYDVLISVTGSTYTVTADKVVDDNTFVEFNDKDGEIVARFAWCSILGFCLIQY